MENLLFPYQRRELYSRMSLWKQNKTRFIMLAKERGFFSALKRGIHVVIYPIREWIDAAVTRLLSRHFIRGFHKLLYYTFFGNTKLGKREQTMCWLGAPAQKNPLDAWIYQEMLYEMKPDFVIELGTSFGGGALFIASIMDLIDHGEIITVDVADHAGQVTHSRITKIHGSSIDNSIVSRIAERVSGKSVLVILDSDHTKKHVLKEMELYSKFVPIGGYMVVEDSNINGHPVFPGWGPGPMEAIREFLSRRNDFEIDKKREKFMVTFYPSGFLKKTK